MKRKVDFVFLITLGSVLIFTIVAVLGEIKEINITNERRMKSLTYCQELLQNINENTNREEITGCEEVVLKGENKTDFFSAYTDYIILYLSRLHQIAFLILMLPVVYKIIKHFKNKYPVHSLMRESYHSFKKDGIKDVIKYAFILPISTIVSILIIGFYTGWKFQVINNGDASMWSMETTSQYPVLLIIIYIVNVFVLSLLYINIYLLVCRKIKKYFLAVLVSVLVLMASSIFIELIFSGIIFGKILKSDFGILFNILNIWNYHDDYGIFTNLFVNIGWLFLSIILLYLFYKNKEKFVIDMEK